MSRRFELGLMRALVVLTVANLVFVPFAQAGARLGPNTAGFVGEEGGGEALPFLILALTATALGALAVLRNSASRAGLALLTFGLFVPLGATAAFVSDWAFVEQTFPKWIALVLVPIGGLGWAIGGAAAAVFLVRFPTGDYQSPRWLWVARAALFSVTLLVAQIFNERFYSSDLQDYGFFYAPAIDSNPIGLDFISPKVFDFLFEVGVMTLLWVALAGSLVSVVVRFVTAQGDERQQLKVVGFTVITVAMMATLAANLHEREIWPWFFEVGAPYLLVLIPLSIGLALFKYRLYDIDLVINKAILYGVMIAFITIVFAAVVFLPFILLGAPNSASTRELLLPMLATLILLIVFQPVKDRLQRWANRLVYGRRATPYEALSDFSKDVAGSTADEDLLDRMAQILAEGTGALRSQVWLLDAGALRLTAAYNASADGPQVLTLDGRHLPSIPNADGVAEVTHRGELLGVLSVAKRPGDPLRAIEHRLLQDLASSAGVVLRNFRLRDELLERLDELRASRQRLVAAQDAERRRLERNLHDGAQQQLVAVKIKLGLARQLDDDAKHDEILSAVMTDMDDAIDSLRALARGIYPPTLAQEGLVTALRDQAAKAPIDTDVSASGVTRYSPEIEAAVYFCTLEAMQNSAKYSGATQTRIMLTGTDLELGFEVVDNGRGFDPATASRGAGLQNMEDRLEALGGAISVASAPGSGTSVRGSIPIADD